MRTAASGTEALGLLDTFNADVIVVDLHMPEVDGCQFIERYRRRRPHGGRTAAIVLISFDDELERHASESEADAWIAKGTDPEELRRTVDRLLSSRLRWNQSGQVLEPETADQRA